MTLFFIIDIPNHCTSASNDAYLSICKSELEKTFKITETITITPLGKLADLAKVEDVIGVVLIDEYGNETNKLFDASYSICKINKETNSADLRRLTSEESERFYINSEQILYFTESIEHSPQPEIFSLLEPPPPPIENNDENPTTTISYPIIKPSSPIKTAIVVNHDAPLPVNASSSPIITTTMVEESPVNHKEKIINRPTKRTRKHKTNMVAINCPISHENILNFIELANIRGIKRVFKLFFNDDKVIPFNSLIDFKHWIELNIANLDKITRIEQFELSKKERKD